MLVILSLFLYVVYTVLGILNSWNYYGKGGRKVRTYLEIFSLELLIPSSFVFIMLSNLASNAYIAESQWETIKVVSPLLFLSSVIVWIFIVVLASDFVDRRI